MLLVPQLSKNLISVKILDNNVANEFYTSSFCIKDLSKEKNLLVGGTEQGLKKLPDMVAMVFPSMTISKLSFVCTNTSMNELSLDSYYHMLSVTI